MPTFESLLSSLRNFFKNKIASLHTWISTEYKDWITGIESSEYIM